MANSSFDDDEFEALHHKRLSAEEAQALRNSLPLVTAWQVVGLQVVAGVLAALAAWALTQRASAGWSAAYGAATVLIPAILFARGLSKQFSKRLVRAPESGGKPRAALSGMGFFVLEALKIAITLVMFFLASRIVTNLEWLALLAGLVVTLKVYWVALLVRSKPKTSN